MKIDNVDAFKKWLVTVLVPIFDGDPEKLALYIVALSKKVENDQASKERCVSDLEVFLETNTNSFVDTLFDSLLTKNYLNPSASNNNNNNVDSNSNQSKSADPVKRSSDFNQTTTNTTTSSRPGNAQYKGRSRDYQEIDVAVSSNLSTNRSIRTSTHGHNRRRKNRSRNRLHRDSSSSSSSSPTTISSSSRRYDRNRSRSKSSFSRSRSSSPKNNISSDISSNNNGVNTKKQRCRDFDEKGFCTLAEYCPYDHGEVVIAPLIPTGGSSNQTNTHGNLQTQQHQQQLPGNHQNFNNNNNNSYNNQRNMKRRNQNQGMMQSQQQQRFNKNQQNSNFNQQQRHISSGNNGNNNNLGGLQQAQTQQQPSNLSNSNDSAQMLFNRQQPPVNRPRNLVSIPTGSTNIDQDNQQPADQTQSFNAQQRGIKRGYNPNNNNYQPTATHPHGALLPTPNQTNVNSQINQGAVGGGQFQQGQGTPQSLSNQMNNNSNINKQVPQLTNNSNYQQPLQPNQQQHTSNTNTNTTLIVKKIPLDLNRVDKMQQHFSKFGQLVEIQCQYENSPDTALIKFATNPQAFAAYKCPQPVFNNRFIRLYWFNNYQKQQQQHQQQNSMQQQSKQLTDEPPVKKLAKERIDYKSIHASDQNTNELINKENQSNREVILENVITTQGDSSISSASGVTSTGTLVKTVFNNEQNDSSQSFKAHNLSSNFNTQLSFKSTDAAAVAASLATKKSNYEKVMAAKLMQDENQKKALLLKMEVQQKARELIEKQIKDQKLLLQKFEQAKTYEEKSQILSLVKKLSESIEKEKEILNNRKSVPTTPLARPPSTSTEPQDKADQEKTTDGVASPSTLFSNVSPFSFQKVPKHHAPIIIPPAPHHLKLNNKRLNNTNFLKHNVSASGTPPSTSTMTAVTAPMSVNSFSSSAFSFSRVSVDNRPKSLLFSGLENSQEKTLIINFINSLGCQIESVNDHQEEINENDTSEDANKTTTPQTTKTFVINFFTRKDAEVALAKCSSSLTSKSISIGWFKQQPQQNQNTETQENKLNALKKSQDEPFVEASETLTATNKVTQNTEIEITKEVIDTPVQVSTKNEISVIKELTETNIKEIINSVTNDDDDDEEDSEAENTNTNENEFDEEENVIDNENSESNDYSISNMIKNNTSAEIKNYENSNQDENEDVFDSLFRESKTDEQHLRDEEATAVANEEVMQNDSDTGNDDNIFDDFTGIKENSNENQTNQENSEQFDFD